MPTTDQFDEYHRQIGLAMCVDSFQLRNQLRSMRQAEKRGQPFDEKLSRFTERLQTSVARREARSLNLPKLSYDESLPINTKRDDIKQAILEHQVLVICGETGSGKSTQLPKTCLEAGRGISGFIGHTQPRRIAARSIASRLAEELHTTVGQHVGYKIRFSDNVSPKSYIKLMTDGILLAETQGDRFLERYDTIIIDEAHERSLNIDFLLGYLKRLLRKRRDLKLIITSATIDAERFSEHFEIDGRAAQVIEVSGRSYPVEVRYRTQPDDEETQDPNDGIIAAVEELCREGNGDILTFLPTERDIRDVAKRLRGWATHRRDKPAILPLYARLPAAEQNRIFNPGGGRRIVLATNVAESSITVPGIRYVVDTGTARISRYAPRSKVQRLPIEPVSQASADQRKGRCGRLGPGICVRLFAEDDYLSRRRFTTPEIRRTNLAAVILQMLSLKLGDIDDFPFLDAPHLEAVRDGYKTLYEVGAIDSNRKLTGLGQRMSRLPVDPRIGRMILASVDEKCLAEILIIASALEIYDPRDRPAEKEKQADECHSRYKDSRSDFMSFLKLWEFFHDQRAELSRNQLQKMCRKNYLSYNRMREWLDVHRQLKQLVEASGLKLKKRHDDYGAIHRALLTGLLSNVAKRIDKHAYRGNGGAKSFLWPGSHVFDERPDWVMSAEVVETKHRYLRVVARINSRWIESRANHLVERTYKNPRWSRKHGTVVANEKVSLFTLPVCSNKGKKYGKINPQESRHLFIRDALVHRDTDAKIDFFVKNNQLVEKLAMSAAKSRSSGLIVSDAIQYDFYNERLPAEVFDLPSLRRWLGRAKPGDAEQLLMNASDLVDDEAFETANAATAEFPDQIQAGETELPVNYQFTPGDETDGASITVPVEALGQIDDYQLEWGVPGLLIEKITALIRSLPKPVRRNLIPAPDVATEVGGSLQFGEGPFLPTIASALSRHADEPIDVSQFSLDTIPRHLRLHIRVVSEEGKLLDQDRDLDELRRRLGIVASPVDRVITDPRWQKDGITDWDFGELPESIELERSGCKIVAFPTLIDSGASVDLRLLGQKDLAEQATRRAIRRLILLRFGDDLAEQIDWLPKLEDLKIYAMTLPNQADLRQGLTELLTELAFVDGNAIPRDADTFKKFCESADEKISLAVQDLVKLVVPLLEGFHQVCIAAEELTQAKWQPITVDIDRQLSSLLPDDFLGETPVQWLEQFPRFFAAILARIERVKSGSVARDQQSAAKIDHWTAMFEERRQSHYERGIIDPELALLRWMIEEFRVSVFAQKLGTSIKVSPERLERQWFKVRT